MSNRADPIARGVRLWTIKNGTALAVMIGILFASAGRLDWIWGWIMLGAYLIIVGCMAWFVARQHPDLIAERSKLQQGTKKWDTALVFLAATGIPIATFVVAGLDARYAWSQPLPAGGRLVMLIPMALGQGLFIWAMAANRFFSATVRIQKDRSHTVATNGPYRYMRHPGYMGSIVWQLCIPVLLGSWWALIPAGLIVPLLILRTALEDRALQNELAGYQEYARQVRYRLLPGVW